MRVIRRADLVAQPWKNGGGVTRTVAVWPADAGLDDFTCRLSLADVAQDGPFSAFAGIDRTLTVIDGAGLVLSFGGTDVALAADGPPLAFPGEAPVAARLTAGPIRDLNVMTRRDAAAHHVCLLADSQPVPANVVALVCRTSGTTIDGIPLEPGDCVMAGADTDLTAADRQGTVIAIAVDFLPPTRNKRAR